MVTAHAPHEFCEIGGGNGYGGRHSGERRTRVEKLKAGEWTPSKTQWMKRLSAAPRQNPEDTRVYRHVTRKTRGLCRSQGCEQTKIRWVKRLRNPTTLSRCALNNTSAVREGVGVVKVVSQVGVGGKVEVGGWWSA